MSSLLSRFLCLAIAAALFLIACPTSAASRIPIVVKVLPSATDVDAEALRDAVAQELGAPVLAPDDPAATGAELLITVGEDHDRGELAVARRSAGGTLVRRVALPR